MRIISGKHGGRKLRAPKSLPVRPTTDRVKEALFNILGNSYTWNSVQVLDLFAGTGNISFEFASRGVAHITSVDSHYGCVKFIAQTAEELSMPIISIKNDAQQFLNRTDQQFDIIFADPPYAIAQETLNTMVNTVFSRNLLRDDGVVILEHDKRLKFEAHPKFTDERKYGGSTLSFFNG